MARDKNTVAAARQRKKAAGTPGGLVRSGGPCPPESFKQSIEENGYAIHTAPTAPCESRLVVVFISHKKRHPNRISSAIRFPSGDPGFASLRIGGSPVASAVSFMASGRGGRGADSWTLRQSRQHRLPRFTGSRVGVGCLDSPLQFLNMPVGRGVGGIVGEAVPNQTNQLHSLLRVEAVNAELRQGQTYQ